ncbi:MAG: hypothetical protein HY711_07235 [Candidatus Melainabacteria bacterium]|nr:hypothetical protein [Candidatus Melainabacteria bacterium]
MTTPKIVSLPVVGTGGSLGLAEVKTDMLLLTKFTGMGLFPGFQEIDSALKGLFSRQMKQARFKGELGESLVIEVDPKAYPGYPQRYILLVGLGSSANYGPKVACKIFQILVDKAHELGVEHVTVQIVPNRLTGATLNLKGTAHLLTEVVEAKLAALVQGMGLQKISVLCTPQARRHIDDGLSIPPRHNRTCCTDVI